VLLQKLWVTGWVNRSGITANDAVYTRIADNTDLVDEVALHKNGQAKNNFEK